MLNALADESSSGADPAKHELEAAAVRATIGMSLLLCRPFASALGRVAVLRAFAFDRNELYLAALLQRHKPSAMALEVMKTEVLAAVQVRFPLRVT